MSYKLLSIASIIAKAIFDSGAGSDFLSIANNLSLSDSANAHDILSSILNQLNVSDSGAGTEIIGVKQLFFKLLSDSALGNEILSALNTLKVTDNATTLEIVNILATLSVLDSAIGIENLFQKGILGKMRVILKASRKEVKMIGKNKTVKLIKKRGELND